MALRTVDAVISLGHLLSLSQTDLKTVGSTPVTKLGKISMVSDDFGMLRIFRYVRILQSGGMTEGQLCTRVAVVTDTITAASGEVNDLTHAAATAIFTSGDEVGKIFQVNVAGAAAPEGESALIVGNDADQLTFASEYPLSTAVASGDTFSDWAIASCDDAAAGDNRINVGGLVMGAPSAKDYGWVQVYGFHPAAEIASASDAPVADDQGVPDTGSLQARGSETNEEFVGWFPMATSTTAVQAAFVIDVWHQSEAID